jgi:hypothetical protein
MRYAHSAKVLARAAFGAVNGFHRKRLEVDDLSDYMRRDLGLIDGRSTLCGGFAAGGGRSRSSLDLLALTRYAS